MPPAGKVVVKSYEVARVVHEMLFLSRWVFHEVLFLSGLGTEKPFLRWVFHEMPLLGWG